jgi:hypothetical protein
MQESRIFAVQINIQSLINTVNEDYFSKYTFHPSKTSGQLMMAMVEGVSERCEISRSGEFYRVAGSNSSWITITGKTVNYIPRKLELVS